jgi:WhiB family redox-sensing transcriptional regulator
MPKKKTGTAGNRGAYSYMDLLNELKLVDPDQDWMKLAACKGQDSTLFFQQRGGNQHHGGAYDICNACPVRVRCLKFAVNNNIEHGIWGGLTPNQRRVHHKRGYRV